MYNMSQELEINKTVKFGLPLTTTGQDMIIQKMNITIFDENGNSMESHPDAKLNLNIGGKTFLIGFQGEIYGKLNTQKLNQKVVSNTILELNFFSTGTNYRTPAPKLAIVSFTIEG